MTNVRDFGAVGDGISKDTAAIQQAIDAGGIVYFPPGTYLAGTLYLRSHGGLDLAPGAVLKASPDPARPMPAISAQSSLRFMVIFLTSDEGFETDGATARPWACRY